MRQSPQLKKNVLQLVEEKDKSKKSSEGSPDGPGFSNSGFSSVNEGFSGFISSTGGVESEKNGFDSVQDGFDSLQDGFGTKKKIGFSKQAALSNLKYVTDRLKKFEKRFKDQYTQDVYYDLPKSF